MYSDKFLRAVDFVLRWEGGYDNDPDDPGGETNFGIDKRSHPEVDIKNLTRAGAIAIYHSDYWKRVRAEELPDKIAEVVMDIGVNNGTGRAIKWLQEALIVTVDGVIGPKTIEAARASVPHLIAGSLLQRRENFYRSIAKGRMAKFLKGWLNRNNDLRLLVS